MRIVTRNRIVICILCLLISFASFAEEVPEDVATRLARNFFYEKIIQSNVICFENLHVANSHTIFEANIPLMYVFNFEDGGFVIVSAENSVFPVLAYSFQNNYDLNDVSPAHLSWMNHYKDQIKLVKENKVPASPEVESTWQRYLSFKPEDANLIYKQKGLEPLLTSGWGQLHYYNEYCPVDPEGYGGHAVAGCVAIAMAQVMYYFRYPEIGEGSYGYNSNYGYEFADFENTQYKWDDMVNYIYHMSNPEIAELIYHVGVSVEMNYNSGGSGANTYDTPNALKSYFRYSPEVSYISIQDTGISYKDSLYKCLDQNIPMIYRGGDITQGHSFVCDGYQDSSFFHFNWGWKNLHDGYYNIDHLNPGGYDFTFNQCAVINIFPNENYPNHFQGADTLTMLRGTFTDGSGHMNYLDNQNCSWLIQPDDPDVTNLQLWFPMIDMEENKDFLSIYDGPNDTDPILGVFTGNEEPSVMSSTSNQVLVVFSSDSDNTARGFSGEYISYSEPFCDELSTFTSLDYKWIADGSGPFQYINYSSCDYLIAPGTEEYDSISNIKLFFHKFDLAEDDTLFIYNGDSDNADIIQKLTGNSIPDTLESMSDKIFMRFETNEVNTAQGWLAGYYSKFPVYCSDTLVLTDSVGLFGDGSGNYNYSNYSNCNWLISPEGADHITITFKKFDLESGYDRLKIYDAGVSPPQLISTFSGHQIPDPLSIQSNKVLIRFSSDNLIVFDGWEIEYSSVAPGIDENEMGNRIRIYPNPVKATLNVKLPPEMICASYTVYNISGKPCSLGIFLNLINTINVENLDKGVYYIKVDCNAGSISKKFIK